jgi:hypothetical protein
MLRLTAPKNSVGHPAMEQNASYRVTFFEAVGDGSQHPVGISPDLTETLARQVGSDIRTKFGGFCQRLRQLADTSRDGVRSWLF